MAIAAQISDALLLLGNENCPVCQMLLRLRQALEERRPLSHSLMVAWIAGAEASAQLEGAHPPSAQNKKRR
jgi:hypothetical protein